MLAANRVSLKDVAKDQSRDNEIPLPLPTQGAPSQTANLILMMQEHGVHAIAELDQEIDALDERRQELVNKRETIQRMLDIALAHKTINKK